jgi:hypothetical protein
MGRGTKSVEFGEDARDIGTGLGKGRDATVFADGFGPGVVRGEGKFKGAEGLNLR